MQLVAEIKRMGATIVYASYHRIVVATAKDTMDTAIAYIDYMLRSIHSKQLFEILELHIGDHWYLLAWMDEVNYAGILSNRDDLNAEPTLFMEWNIQEYFPMAVQSMFRDTVVKFVSKANELKRMYPRHVRRQAMEIDGEENQTQDEHVDERLQQLRLYVREKVMGKLVRWINHIQHKQDTSDEFQFPQLSGSYLKLSNPVLECAKSICAVLALDPNLENEVRVVKRNALQSIGGLSDFSPEARFENPCQYVKLHEIICTKCNYVADLDVCRDKNLIPLDGQPQPWCCHLCKTEYDKCMIEQNMANQVERWLVAFQLQDVQCPRCRIIKKENMLRQCDKCGCDYLPLQSKAELERKLKVFQNIAEEQHFVYLSEVIRWTFAHL